MQRATLRSKRLDKGLQIQQAAKEMGISRTYLSRVEHGRLNPSLHIAIRIAEFYEVEIAEFKNLFKKDEE